MAAHHVAGFVKVPRNGDFRILDLGVAQVLLRVLHRRLQHNQLGRVLLPQLGDQRLVPRRQPAAVLGEVVVPFRHP